MKAGLDDYVLKSPEHFSRFNNAVHTALSRVSVRRAKLRAEEKYRTWLNKSLPSSTPPPSPSRAGRFTSVRKLRSAATAKKNGLPIPICGWTVSTPMIGSGLDPPHVYKPRTLHRGIPFDRARRAHIMDRDEGRVVTDADGKPLHLQGVMLDVTERKRVEEALAQ